MKWDVIVVLGSSVLKGGNPSQSLRCRVTHAAELFREGKADVLILTGGVGRHPPSEALVMQHLAIEHGIPSEQMILEETARSTLDNASACARIMLANSWKTALVVTDSYHLPRSLFLFRRFGVEAQGSAPADLHRRATRLHTWYLYARELLAFPYSFVRVNTLKK